MNASLPSGILVSNFPAAQRSLRVAFVTETYPPEVNGVSLTIARVVEGLHRRNHDVQLVRPRQAAGDAAEQSPRFHEVLMRGLPIPRYPHLRMGMPSKKQLVQLWAMHRPDVVHIATEGPLGYSALQAARHLKLPLTSDFRTNFHAYSQHYGVGWLRKPIMAYLRKFHNRTAITMVPTEPLRRELTAAGFRNVTVVARGVDTRRFSPAWRSQALRASWGAGEDTCVVAHVGRLAPEKNLGLLVRAFEALRRVWPDSKLLLVGDGPARADLLARCPDALFAGMRSGDDLAAHYASADAFVFPSMTETFGNVTPEAMASGLPVLAFDHAAAGQLIQSGRSGLLVPMGDADAFVAMARELVADPQRAQQWGVSARAATLACQWDQVVAQVEGLMRVAMNRHPTASPLSSASSTMAVHATSALHRASTPPG